MNPVDNSLFQQFVHIIRQQLGEVQAVYAFGSQATGTARSDSDIDLAVLTSKPSAAEKLFTLAGELAVVAKRHVDLVDLRTASTVMRSQIIAHGQRIYCGAETACEQFEDLVYSSYAHLNEERRYILEDIHTRGRIHG